MRQHTHRRSTIRTTLASLACASAVAGMAGTSAPAIAHEVSGPLNGETRSALAELRAATAKYHNIDVAYAEGFVASTGCVSNPDGPGAMGVHFLDPSRLATGFEVTKPEVLIYEPQKNGRMRFVGVEYVVLDADQDPATEERPVFPGGVAFHGPDGGHDRPLFYQLHAYVGKHNPDGMFTDYNPRNTCR